MLKRLTKPTFYSLLKTFSRGVSLCYLVLSLVAQTALCQTKDTTYIYYKLAGPLFRKVSTIDSADFIKILYPADRANNLIPVKQFYANGQLNFIASYDLSFYKGSKIPILVGDYISYYPNGKKQSYVHYTTKGYKQGLGYLFYPNGKVYCSKKYAGAIQTEEYDWDCYNNNGLQICENGNGQWITYDSMFVPVLEGPVKDGLPEGVWHGKTFEADSIKYTYVFKKGKFVSGTGYDRFGKQYPFTNYIDESSIWINIFFFVNKLRTHFKLPDKTSIKMSALDTAFVSFILEKDGRLTNAEIIGNNDPALNQALQNALDKCTGETPKRYYGIPLRSKITMSFKIMEESKLSSYNYTIPTREQTSDATNILNEPTRINKVYINRAGGLLFKEELLELD